MADNVVEIVVKSRDETRAGFDKAKEEARLAGFEAGREFQKGASEGAKTPVAAGAGGGGAPYGILAGIAAALPAAPALGAIAGAGFIDAVGAAILIGSKKHKGPVYDAFHDFTSQITRTMQTAARPLAQPLREAFGSLRTFFRSLGPELTTLFTASGKFIYPFTKGLESLISGVLPGLIKLIEAGRPAFRAFGQVLGDIGKGLGGFFAALAPAMKPAAQYLQQFGQVLGTLLPLAGRLIASLAPLGPVIGKLALSFLQVVKALLPLIPPLVKLTVALMPVLINVVNLLAQALALVVPPIAKVLTHVASAIDWFIKWISSTQRVSAAMAAFGAFLSRIWNDIVNGVSSMVGKVISWFQGLPGRILSAVGSLGTLLWNAGASVISGLIGGIKSAVGGLMNVVSGIGSTVSGVFKSVLGIGSPSKVFEQHGRNIVAGLVGGINAAGPGATAAMRRLGVSGLPGGYGAPYGWPRLQIIVSYDQTARRGLGDGLLRDLRYSVNTIGGGNVQAAFGSGT